MPAHNQSVGSASYGAEIRWTTHGVAHIRGGSLANVAFGQAYAIAGSHLPIIADQILKTRSQRSLHFGRGENDQHINSDFGYLAMGVTDWAERMSRTQPDHVLTAVDGYAAGLNQWLIDNGRSALPEWCRDAEWIREVDSLDLFGLYADMALMASGRNVAQFVGAAQPPGSPPVAHPDGPLVPDDHPGSNGWALGGELTDNGRGMVMANPHFPWYGDGRFWECHLTIPGEMDVYGVCLIGAPGVHIGFNRDVAWTHTFSAGQRFNFYSLTLDPTDPTRYTYGDETRSMTSNTHEIGVRSSDGSVERVERTMWSSHYGPMLDVPLLGWSPALAFSLADINNGNERFLAQYLAMDTATSVESLRDTVRFHQGIPWVNVIAADRHGDAWYADPSPAPRLSPEAEAAFDIAVRQDPITMLFYSQRVAILNGSDPANEWVTDERSAAAGMVPIEDLPELRTRGAVFNSNDPYWVPGPDATLEQGPVFCGLYGRPLSPRTRMNATVLAGDAPSGPTGDGDKWTTADVERALLDNRSLLAEQLLDGVIERCATSGDETLERAASVLAGWDRAFDINSKGAVLWREFLATFSEADLRGGGSLFAIPFDMNDPVRTPRDLAAAPASGTDPVHTAMWTALDVLASTGIAPDCALGDVQFIERSGQRIPLHGGNEVEGIVNVVAPVGALASTDLEPRPPAGDPIPGRTERTGLCSTGYPVTYGASTVMVVGFDD
ncbi:MAG: penicillin acylase family protein, partial [Microthrixaceae bacterium]|nr:penicillin acylase family protein [Microthrixaceae bacterium]